MSNSYSESHIERHRELYDWDEVHAFIADLLLEAVQKFGQDESKLCAPDQECEWCNPQ